MTFQAKASGSSLRFTVYAADTPLNVTTDDPGGNPIGGVQVASGQTQSLDVPAASGQIYQLTIASRRSRARFRLMARGIEWLRLPDDGDNWSGGYNPGPSENNGVESSIELGFDRRWNDAGAPFADTTWFFNAMAGDAQFESQACIESPYGDANRSIWWTDPTGQWRGSTWSSGIIVGCTSLWTADPTPGFWGMQLLAAPPYSPWPQHYTVAKADAGADDWVYLLPGSMAGPPCGASVVLDPVGGSFCQGKILRLNTVIADVANLYGAEVHMQYDTSRLEVVDEAGNPAYEVVPGPFLDPASGLIGLNAAGGGYIDYAISLKDPALPAFGGGVLATVYFRATGTGRADVTITQVKLSGKPQPPQPPPAIPAQSRNASFNLGACAQTGAMKGKVYLDGRAVHAGAAVTTDPGGSAALTLPDGAFELPALAAGAYNVDVTHASYLRAGPRPFGISVGGTLNLGNVTLLGGDINGDDKINITDGAILAKSFARTRGPPEFTINADINDDGVVDIYDLVMVGNNFGCALADTSARCRRWGRP